MTGDLTCGGCAFWHPIDGQPYGKCRRHAPRPLMFPPSHWRAREPVCVPLWPATAPDDWCAEYAAPAADDPDAGP